MGNKKQARREAKQLLQDALCADLEDFGARIRTLEDKVATLEAAVLVKAEKVRWCEREDCPRLHPEADHVEADIRQIAPGGDVDAWRAAKSKRAEPLLGLAKTRELLDELAARIEVDGYNGGGGLDYTTVGRQ